MRLPVLLAFLLACLVATAASAIVIRHDVDDEKYRIPASDFPAPADMPSEGHGGLIAQAAISTGDWILPVFSRRLKVVRPVSTTGVN